MGSTLTAAGDPLFFAHSTAPITMDLYGSCPRGSGSAILLTAAPRAVRAPPMPGSLAEDEMHRRQLASVTEPKVMLCCLLTGTDAPTTPSGYGDW